MHCQASHHHEPLKLHPTEEPRGPVSDGGGQRAGEPGYPPVPSERGAAPRRHYSSTFLPAPGRSKGHAVGRPADAKGWKQDWLRGYRRATGKAYHPWTALQLCKGKL